MKTKLIISALVKYILGLLLCSAFIFIPAGTINYPNGIKFLTVLFVPMFIMGVVLLCKDPELLTKRLNAKEKEDTQQMVIKISGLLFIVGFVVAGLDYRYNWTNLSSLVSNIATVIFLIAYGLYAEVLRENTYLSRTVEIQEDQEVIDSGLYGIVRHPMYSVTLFLFLSIPLILGSFLSFIIFLHYPIIIVIRIKNEEKVLESGLKGYKAYKQKVKYRLIPYIY